MTSEIHVRIKGHTIMAKAGGYTGKNEARTPKGDVRTANRIWVKKVDARRLHLKKGSKVTMYFDRDYMKKGKVTGWSRGSAEIIFDEPGLPKYIKVYSDYEE